MKKTSSKLVVFFFVLLFLSALGFFSYTIYKAYSFLEPLDILVSNISDTGATVIWRTQKPERGCLVLVRKAGKETGNSGCFLEGSDLFDDQDIAKSSIHITELYGLEPETSYQFRISSNGKINTKSPTFSVNTKTVPEDILPPYPIFGKVIGFASQETGVVFLDIGGSLKSVLLSSEGGWSIDLSEYKTKILDKDLSVSTYIYTKTGVGGRLELDIGNLQPVEDIIVDTQTGEYNFASSLSNVKGITDNGFGPLNTEAMDSCTNLQIFDGSDCIEIEKIGEIDVVGLDNPINSRSKLDSIEKHFMKRRWEDKLTDDLLLDITKEKAERIQEIRQEFWQTQNQKERTIEFIISKKAYDKLKEYGEDDPVVFLKNQVIELNAIWAKSDPPINMRVKLDRIIIAGSGLMTDEKTWEVVNSTEFNFWANDVLKGDPIKGNIPYDIDSRWAGLDLGWAKIYENFGTNDEGQKIDYGLLHELTHHLPVGDLYRYTPADGGNLIFPFKDDQNLGFRWSDISFIEDHMKSPSSNWLSPLSSYAILFHQLVNQILIRLPQGGQAFEDFGIYGKERYFADQLKIEIEDVTDIDDCILLVELEQDPNALVQENPSSLIRRIEGNVQVKFENDKCILELPKQNQIQAYPGLYIGLVKDEMTLPIYIPRILYEAEYWKDMIARDQITPYSSFTLKLKANKENLADLFSNFAEYIEENEYSFKDENNEDVKFNYIDSRYISGLSKESSVKDSALIYGDVLGGYQYFVSFESREEDQQEEEEDDEDDVSITYELSRGWNLISIPFKSESIQKASDLIEYIKTEKEVQVRHIARFSGGRWLVFSQDENYTYSQDFQLVPEEGYFVYLDDSVEFEIQGYYEREMNYQFSRGWNLFGSSAREVESFEDSSKFLDAQDLENYQTSVFSSWEEGLYQTFMIEDSIEYGSEIPLEAGKAYFIKLV